MAAMQTAAQKLASLGVSTKQIAKLQPGQGSLTMFQRLPVDQQRQLLQSMSQAESRTYLPKANKKLRDDPEK